MKTKLIYLVYDGLETSVFSSQVLALIRKLNSKNLDIDLIIFNSIKKIWCYHNLYRQEQHQIRKELKINVILLPRITRNLFFINSIMFFFCLLKYIIVGRPLVIHARNTEGTAVALFTRYFTKQVRIICDYRGVGAEEYLYRQSPHSKKRKNLIINLVYRHFKKTEGAALQKADYIFCVSDTLKKYTQEQYHIKNTKISVIPCCINPNIFQFNSTLRKTMRKKLNLENKIVIVYNGTMKKWQLPLKMIEIFRIIKKQVKSAVFLIITQEQKIIKKYLISSGLQAKKDYLIFTVPPEKIAGYLMSGDVGLLLREDNLLNNVAFPTKFAEYLACGNLILTSPAVSDIKNLVIRYQLGAVIDNLDSNHSISTSIRECLDFLMAEKEAIKIRLSRTSRDFLSWDKYLPEIIKNYQL